MICILQKFAHTSISALKLLSYSVTNSLTSTFCK